MKNETAQPNTPTPEADSAVYDELRRIALGMMQSERVGHTLQATALVHEAWLRIAGKHGSEFRDRRHFLAMVTTIMRRVLVDYARARATLRRGGKRMRLAIDELADSDTDRHDLDLLILDEALKRLARIDARQAKVVEYRQFGGLTLDEIAAEMDLSARTIDREWTCAKAWLFRELAGREPKGCSG